MKNVKENSARLGLESYRVLKAFKYLGISTGICVLSILMLNFEYLGKSYSKRTLPLIKSNRITNKKIITPSNSKVNSFVKSNKPLTKFLIISQVFENESSAKKALIKLHQTGFEQASYFKKTSNEFLICLQDTYSKDSAVMLKNKLQSLGVSDLSIYTLNN